MSLLKRNPINPIGSGTSFLTQGTYFSPFTKWQPRVAQALPAEVPLCPAQKLWQAVYFRALNDLALTPASNQMDAYKRYFHDAVQFFTDPESNFQKVIEALDIADHHVEAIRKYAKGCCN